MNAMEVIEKLKKLLVEAGPNDALTQLANELKLNKQDAFALAQKSIEIIIKTKLLQALTAQLEEAKPPLEKINVTDLAFPCLKHAFYSKKFVNERRGKFSELVTLWVGTKLHEVKILNQHEVEVEYNDIYGRVDGYGDGVILELKTTRKIPPQPFPHHLKQVNYYRVLLERNNYPVAFAVILYVNIANSTAKAFLILFEQSLEDTEREMIERKERLVNALKSDTPPPSIPEEPWACDYCDFAYLCGLQRETPPRKDLL
ncbi:MAG: Dna2/Cas4 domain-containing protein [Crenarchaeota archaeon]|nr:Dna2/Cas4 domain-containing protein [Thermoproteota archaeon]MCR8470663.1 Dna2/Cas4 domain-containing protein [Thermoproteota archaeon]MCR8473400.1 Dna2/Cas4 domain-containing protein [Thermoproteota archaeon]